MSVADELRKAADLGYSYLELSPRADWFFWQRYPKADDALIAETKKAAAETGVTDPDAGAGVQLVLARRAGAPGPGAQLAAAAADRERPGVPRRQLRALGRPDATRCSPSTRSTARWRSSIPDFERYGIGLNLEAHPYDFSETNDDAVADHPRAQPAVGQLRVLRAARLPPLRRGGRRAADDDLRRGRSCSTCTSPTASTTGRTSATATSSTRPGSTPASTSTTRSATARWTGPEFFGALRDLEFDGIATVCVFGWEEHADDIHRRMLERVTAELRS